jgi:hypothetical protein
MAALLYEHAAREAVYRFQLGDPQPRNLLVSPHLRPGFQRLLDDREPLVWQPAAVARGFLAAIHSDVRHQVEQSLDPGLGITQWRRGAVSLVASVVLGDHEAHRSVLSVLDGEIAQQDRGLTASMVAGLVPLIEMEPERCEQLIDRMALTRRPDVAISMADVFARSRDRNFAQSARATLRSVLAEAGRTQCVMQRQLAARAMRVLAGADEDEPDLVTRVHSALFAFEEEGARQAYEVALQAIAEAHQLASFIEANDPIDEDALGAAVGALVELDNAALERATLSNLLLLGKAPGDPTSVVEQFERLQNRTSNWILDGVERSGHTAWSREAALVCNSC